MVFLGGNLCVLFIVVMAAGGVESVYYLYGSNVYVDKMELVESLLADGLCNNLYM